MAIAKFKINDLVMDTWYPEWGAAKIVKVLRTRYKLRFASAPPEMKDQNNNVTYDFAHAHLFLELRTK